MPLSRSTGGGGRGYCRGLFWSVCHRVSWVGVGRVGYASAGLCLQQGVGQGVSDPSPITASGQGHCLMIALDENRNCHSK